MTITIADGLLILAALAGPVLAVQAQKWVERASEAGRRRRSLFLALMGTRGARLSFDHVRALNGIDIEFYGEKRFSSVIERWHIYHDHLSEQNIPDSRLDDWVLRGDELFLDLLHAMAQALNYTFDRVQLKRGSYTPRAHGEDETVQRGIRDSLSAILSGSKPFPITLTAIVQTPEGKEFQRLVADCLSGKAPLQVIVRQ